MAGQELNEKLQALEKEYNVHLTVAERGKRSTPSQNNKYLHDMTQEEAQKFCGSVTYMGFHWDGKYHFAGCGSAIDLPPHIVNALTESEAAE